MHDITEMRDTISGELCTFRRVGAMMIADDIADSLLAIAPTAARINSWDNAAFSTQAYKAIRAAGFYTESTLDPHSTKRRFRLLVLPAISDANRLRLQAMRRAYFQL